MGVLYKEKHIGKEEVLTPNLLMEVLMAVGYNEVKIGQYYSSNLVLYKKNIMRDEKICHLYQESETMIMVKHELYKKYHKSLR